MAVNRNYRRRGTPDLPIATYIGIAGKNMSNYIFRDCHQETEIVLQVSGTTVMQIGGAAMTYHSGDIILIPPNVVHHRLHYSKDARIHSIVFSTEAIQMRPEHYFQREFVQPLSEERLEMPAILQPGHPAYDAVYHLISQLESCRIYEKNYRQQRLFILMGICLALMPYCRVITDRKPIPDPGHEAVKLCMRYIHNNYRQKLSLEQIAEYCHLNPNYLCTVFKQFTGETVFGYLTRIRVETAQELLRREKLPVDKVAELTGFRSECLFYQKFKAHTGMTPKAYARQKQDAKNEEG